MRTYEQSRFPKPQQQNNAYKWTHLSKATITNPKQMFQKITHDVENTHDLMDS